MSHITWEHYTSLYNKITEEDFPRIEKEAEAKVRSVIGPIRWAEITEETFGYDILQDTIISVMHILADNEKNNIGKGISSVSNDGYSVSYSQTSKEEAEAELRDSIVNMLSGSGMVGAY